MSARATRTPANHCPHCGYRVDAASPAGDKPATPKEGDISLCICCRGVSVFRADLTLRLPTGGEFGQIVDALGALNKRRVQ